MAIVPPTTNVARSAPGRSERSEILRWSRKRGVQSQKIIEPAIQAGSSASQPSARSSDAETVISAISPLKAKNQIVKQHLVGRRADVDAPGPRVHVLVQLSDRESPDQEADHDRDRGCQEIVRRGAEQVVDEARRRPVEVHVRDQTLGKRILVPSGLVEDRDDDERRREHRQRDVARRRGARVPARLEVAAKPEEREPGEARVGPATQPIPRRRQPASARARSLRGPRRRRRWLALRVGDSWLLAGRGRGWSVRSCHRIRLRPSYVTTSISLRPPGPGDCLSPRPAPSSGLTRASSWDSESAEVFPCVRPLSAGSYPTCCPLASPHPSWVRFARAGKRVLSSSPTSTARSIVWLREEAPSLR